MKQRSYKDLNELLYQRKREGEPLSKTELARLLSRYCGDGRTIWPSKLTTLLNPTNYRASLDEPLIAAIARVLNQSPEYVRAYYAKAQAA